MIAGKRRNVRCGHGGKELGILRGCAQVLNSAIFSSPVFQKFCVHSPQLTMGSFRNRILPRTLPF